MDVSRDGLDGRNKEMLFDNACHEAKAFTAAFCF